MPQCPCGSDLDYDACCGRFHAGEPAPTAVALMRSRYAAYALGRLDYIEATAGGPAAMGFVMADAQAAQLGMEWTGLEVLSTKKGREGDDDGIVSFVASYRHNGVEGSLAETSRFRRIAGRWLYWDRDEAPARAAQAPGRNDPCPCGSGRKFKKCCG